MSAEERDNEQLGIIVSYCAHLDDVATQYSLTYERLCVDAALQDSCVLCIIQIGEAIDRLSDEFKREHPGVPWSMVSSMHRHFLRGWGTFDADVVWNALQNYIPPLRTFCEEHWRP